MGQTIIGPKPFPDWLFQEVELSLITVLEFIIKGLDLHERKIFYVK